MAHDSTTSRIGTEALQRLIDAQVEPSPTDVTKPIRRGRPCTIDREDMVTTQRAATSDPRKRQRRRRMMFPAVVVDLAGKR